MRRAVWLGLLVGWPLGLAASMNACDPGCETTPPPDNGRFVVVDGAPPELVGAIVEIRNLVLTLPLEVDGEVVAVEYHATYEQNEARQVPEIRP